MTLEIGVIGLGTIENRTVGNIVKARFDLSVYDLLPEPFKKLIEQC